MQMARCTILPLLLLLLTHKSCSLRVPFSRRGVLAAGAGAIGSLAVEQHEVSRLPFGASVTAAMPLADTASSPLCDPCVSIVKTARGQEVTIVGTAHISEDSATLVSRVIQFQHPDTVMIELDPSRAVKLIGRASPTLKLVDPQAAFNRGEGPPTALNSLPSSPLSLPQPSTTPTYGIGRIAGRLMRGDLEEAKTDVVGAGLAGLYKQLDSMGKQQAAASCLADSKPAGKIVCPLEPRSMCRAYLGRVSVRSGICRRSARGR